MFLEQSKKELIEAWLRYSPFMHFAVSPSRKFVFANDAFLNWCGYSTNELLNRTLVDITAREEQSNEDLLTPGAFDGFRSQRQTQIQLLPKNGKPTWGMIHVMRFPPSGDTVDFYLCSWDPAENGQSAVFKMAMERMAGFEQSQNAMNQKLAILTTRTDEETVVVSIVRLSMKHPKKALAVILFLLSITGYNQVLEALQRSGVVPLPSLPPVKHISGEPPAAAAAYQIFDETNEGAAELVAGQNISRHFKATTPAGRLYSWSISANEQPKSMSPVHGQPDPKGYRVGPGSGRIGGGRTGIHGSGDGGTGLPDGTPDAGSDHSDIGDRFSIDRCYSREHQNRF